MKCLTVRQPWATLIALGIKTVENRTWFTKHRGPLLIHAGKGIDKDGMKLVQDLGLDLPTPLPRGVLVCRVNVVDCVPIESLNPDPDGGASDGPQCWLLESPEPVPPIAIDGKLGLFDVEF